MMMVTMTMVMMVMMGTTTSNNAKATTDISSDHTNTRLQTLTILKRGFLKN
jgi:hypothetical protein